MAPRSLVDRNSPEDRCRGLCPQDCNKLLERISLVRTVLAPDGICCLSIQGESRGNPGLVGSTAVAGDRYC